MTARLSRLLLLGTIAAINIDAVAESLPLWELGAGAAAIRFPDYRGSNRQQSYLLPVPIFVYRGEFFQADREKLRGLLFKTDRTELELSINGSVPVRSQDNPAREGMPNLDPTLEIGPSLNVKLYEANLDRLTLRLPLRSALAIDFPGMHNAGLVANPNLNLDLRAPQGWRVGLVAGALFGDRRYHDTFYGVAPQYARAGRPAYAAPGGFSGTQFIVAVSKKFEPVWVAGFVKTDLLNGAAFLGSPLVERRNNVSFGIAVTYVFARSANRVERRD